MKKTILLLTALVFAAPASFAEEAMKPWQTKTLELVKAEKQVRDAIWSQSISLWVGLDDDGTNRSGFGEYLCMVTTQAGRPAGQFVAISLLDYSATLRGERVEIGKALCQ